MPDARSDFEGWARATANAAGDHLIGLLADAGVAAAHGGEGGPKSTGVGYRSQYVTFNSAALGRLAIWLYVVPPGHEYGTSERVAQMAAGLMRDSNTVVAREELAFGGLGQGNPFRWRRLKGGWEGYALILETDGARDVRAAGRELAEAVARGLDRGGLDR